uniref:Uncharacterized protein n=2 Tax=Magallana gigas TaxID=29159 RepID=A0A8W8NJ16_MAGGI|nr:scavenger receptor class F member 2-like isoform X1 [Crassostrea gigas]
MLGCDYNYIFCLLIFLWASFGSIYSKCLQNNGSCCVNYYRDVESRLCKPCNGSFGVNCSFSCPKEYFGHGCREKCYCINTETCDSKIGCVARNYSMEPDQKNISDSSTINMIVYVILIVGCFLTITILGTVMYFQFIKRDIRR